VANTFRACCFVLSAWLWASAACGQACHLSDLGARPADRLRVSGRALFASYRTPEAAGEYQGYFAGVAYALQPWFFAELQLPAYRLVRDRVVERGLGDVSADLRAAVWRPDPALAVGLELAATLPSGDAEAGLGMGHVMLMPGMWLSWERDALRVLLQLAYGRMLDGGAGPPAGHHNHGGPTPLVNPMNRSELEHALAVSYAFGARLFAGARLLGAVPVAAASGRAREVAGVALGARFAPLELAAELQLPLVGDPFTARTSLTLAAIF
jgi:hypothetical protein